MAEAQSQDGRIATTRPEGLTAHEAARRLAAIGPNELPRPESRDLRRIVLDVLAEPMLALLLAGGFIYLILGSTGEALILLLFATLSIVITVVQESRTERVLESLRDLASPRALVIRDGERRRIAGRDVVPGDLMVVGEGDRVAADALLVSCHDLEADESLLTGEAVPVRKRAVGAGPVPDARPGGDDLPFVFSGSLIVRGTGTAEVVATGVASEIGRIGLSLAQVETATPRLAQETGRLVRLFAFVGIGVTLAVIVLFGLTRGGWLDAVLAGIAIGMSLMPEEFPVVLAVFMAMGAWRISRVRVLTRRANAIEALGAASVLCTDKTGTLTENRMTVVALHPVAGAHWRAGDPGAGLPQDEARDLLDIGCLASEVEPYDPMERAFHALAARAHPATPDGRSLARVYPLAPDCLAVTHVWRMENGTSFVATKGAPEAVARLCRLAGPEAHRLNAAAAALAAEGVRVLAVASGTWPVVDLPDSAAAFHLHLLGLVGLADPLRASVPAAIADCHSAGIRVVMITGDHPATARAIATAAGIDASDVLTGQDLACLDANAVAERIEACDVYARIMPEQKLQLVTALKRGGAVVAMTGDGVNDAPSLKAADIGVAMGDRGTDVAREAAAIVLLDNDFGAIVAAVRLGRRIYDNLGKAMGFIFAVHIPIAGLAVLPLLLGTPILFGPVHIAFLEMVIDPVCSLVFEAEREERDIMRRPPRAADARMFSRRAMAWASLQGGVALAAVAALYLTTLSAGYPATDVRALSFVTLVVVILALIAVNRSHERAVFAAVFRPNRTLVAVLAVILPVLAFVIFWSPLSDLFGFGRLHGDDLALVAAAGAAVLVVLQMLKDKVRPA